MAEREDQEAKYLADVLEGAMPTIHRVICKILDEAMAELVSKGEATMRTRVG